MDAHSRALDRFAAEAATPVGAGAASETRTVLGRRHAPRSPLPAPDAVCSSVAVSDAASASDSARTVTVCASVSVVDVAPEGGTAAEPVVMPGGGASVTVAATTVCGRFIQPGENRTDDVLPRADRSIALNTVQAMSLTTDSDSAMLPIATG